MDYYYRTNIVAKDEKETHKSVEDPKESPRVGVERSSLKTNPLIAKAQLGKSKTSSTILENRDIAFGKPVTCDEEGAGDCA